MKFNEAGEIIETLGDLTGRAHPMVTSMREHKGYLYIGGILNNRIGRYRLPGADPELDGNRLLLGQAAMIFDRLLDVFRGKAVTIPPLDGAFRPNTALDECEAVTAAVAPDNLCSDGSRILYTSGNELRRLDDGAVVSQHDAPVAAIAASPTGDLAIALDDGRLFVAGRQIAMPEGLFCPTALAFGPGGGLFVSQRLAPAPAIRLGRRPSRKECRRLGLAHRSGQRRRRLPRDRSGLSRWARMSTAMR